MNVKKELWLVVIFFIVGIILVFNRKDEEPDIISFKNHIEVKVSGEIVRDTTLIFYNPTTYGTVFKSIDNLKNEYSDFSKFDFKEKINESLTINIPTLDINNQYNPNNNKICINKATKEELITLYQIGEKRADKILLYINQNKRINSWMILKEIISVSNESIERIKEQAYL